MSFVERTGKPRSPKEIVKAMLAAQVAAVDGKPGDTFAYILNDAADEVDEEVTAAREEEMPGSALAEATRKAGEFKTLMEALATVQEEHPLSDTQRTAIKNSGNLVRLMIAASEELGGESHDNALRPHPFMKKMLDLGMDAKGYSEEGKEHRHQLEQKERIRMARIRTQEVLLMRDTILPLLEELSGALHLPLNKPKGGIA